MPAPDSPNAGARPVPALRVRGQAVDLSTTLVMGVLNANPDSFSRSGAARSADEMLAEAEEMVDAGAHIIDIGGQSAITGRPEVDAATESARVTPLVAELRRSRPEVLISVDTYKTPVVESVLAAGAHMINDVSGLRFPEVAGLCGKAGAALVLMHTAAPPKVRRQDALLYDDVVADVRSFLVSRMQVAADEGLPEDSIVLDPGPDFTKTPHQTVEILRSMDRFWDIGRPLLLALSRKDFLGAVTGRTPRARDAATHAAIAVLAVRPGSIVRVHDVPGAVDVITTVETLTGRRDVAPSYLLPDEIRHE